MSGMMIGAAAVAGGHSLAPSKYLAIGMQNTDNLQIFDVATSTKMTIAGSQPTYRGYPKFSPDETKLAIPVTTNGVKVYQAPAWSLITTPSGSIDGQGCDWSPDGLTLAVACLFGDRLALYDTSSWELKTNPSTLPTQNTNGVAYSPDGTKLAFVGDGGTLAVYNAATLAVINQQVLSGSPQLYKLAWYPDGSKIVIAGAVTSGKSIWVVDATTWAVTNPAIQPTGSVYDVAISKDGLLAAFAWNNSADKFLVYNIPSWTRVAAPSTPPTDSESRGVAFSADGKFLSITQTQNTGAAGVLTYRVSDWSLQPALTPTINDTCWGIDYS